MTFTQVTRMKYQDRYTQDKTINTIKICIFQDKELLSFKVTGDRVYNIREGEKDENIKFKQKKTMLEEAFQKPIGKEISFKFENFGKN